MKTNNHDCLCFYNNVMFEKDFEIFTIPNILLNKIVNYIVNINIIIFVKSLIIIVLKRKYKIIRI